GRLATAVPAIDERLVGTGGVDGLRGTADRADPALCGDARADRPRQSAVFCVGNAAPRLRCRRGGRESSGTTDDGRGEPIASGEPRLAPPCHPAQYPIPVRSGSLTSRSAARPHQFDPTISGFHRIGSWPVTRTAGTRIRPPDG